MRPRRRPDEGRAPASAVARVENTEPARCCEGDVWSIAFAGTTYRIKDSRGLRYLALLFAHPGREFHASEIVA